MASWADELPGVHLRACGHAAHASCLRKYRESLLSRVLARMPYDGIEVADVAADEMLCPACRRFVNCEIPLACPAPDPRGAHVAAVDIPANTHACTGDGGSTNAGGVAGVGSPVECPPVRTVAAIARAAGVSCAPGEAVSCAELLRSVAVAEGGGSGGNVTEWDRLSASPGISWPADAVPDALRGLLGPWAHAVVSAVRAVQRAMSGPTVAGSRRLR